MRRSIGRRAGGGQTQAVLAAALSLDSGCHRRCPRREGTLVKGFRFARRHREPSVRSAEVWRWSDRAGGWGRCLTA